uniref:Rubisco LSMT substrate-binding domain-containing protein n=1 Tax=Strombidium inclinatum TaxID=197538 RepID=A0A7S3N3N8_9SPIT|mmetsp:Transcript_7496/g.11681  ORF Transcript_7496/g.11681 Transcript_7496/m.11681 type:complete len:304 (+) Transcript_7496:924-1835(+)
MIVSSRIFGITVNGVKTDGFVPYADMLNHKRPRQTTWYYSDERQGFVIEACDDIERGSQVYDSYGKKCNSRFFLNYGFINPGNDANEVPLVIYLNQADSGYDIKMKLINEAKPFQKFRVVDNLDEKVMNEFLSWIRYVEFDGDLAQLYLAKNEAITEAQRRRQNNQQAEDSEDSDDVDLQDVFKGTSLKPVSLVNELKVWGRVEELARESLERYPSSLEDDRTLLAEDDKESKLSYNERNCVLFRVGEKEILEFLVKSSKRMMMLGGLSQKEAKKEVNKYDDFEGCMAYFKSVILPFLSSSSS